MDHRFTIYLKLIYWSKRKWLQFSQQSLNSFLYKNCCTFSCDQAAVSMVLSVYPSVRLTVCPSVSHTFFTMFLSLYHHDTFWASAFKTFFSPIWAFPDHNFIWIHTWLRNYAHSFKCLRRDAPWLLKIVHQILRSHGPKNRQFDPRFPRFQTITSVWIHRCICIYAQSLEGLKGNALLFL